MGKTMAELCSDVLDCMVTLAGQGLSETSIKVEGLFDQLFSLGNIESRDGQIRNVFPDGSEMM